MTKLEQLKRHLKPGHVYRREDLAQWSNAIDRHLKQLTGNGTLTKLAPGLYLYPKKTVFGKTPADDEKLVEAFLKDPRFLLAPPNAYNTLGGWARPSSTTRRSCTITNGTATSR
jgi:hypothetical protein